jgi:hypothetical protein
MNRFLITAFIIFTSLCYSQITSVRTVFVEDEYIFALRDSQTAFNVNSNSNSTVSLIVPSEKREIFKAGTKIYGTSLTNGTVIISGQSGVTIINADNAFRTKSMGSQWVLTKLANNFWILDGDLYSIDIDSYIGDDVTIKAKVDPLASSPLVFTWYKNGVVLQGKTQASLKISNAQISDSGKYKVDVKNNKGYSSSEITSLFIR